jgi:hypothetical protein
LAKNVLYENIISTPSLPLGKKILQSSKIAPKVNLMVRHKINLSLVFVACCWTEIHKKQQRMEKKPKEAK